jgi:hypothetical protein
MAKYLSKEQIVSATDVKTIDLDIPEWGGTVRVRNLSALEREQFIRDIQSKNLDLSKTKIAWVARCLIQEDGNPIFSSTEIELLGNKSAKALDRVVDAIESINALTVESMKEIESF